MKNLSLFISQSKIKSLFKNTDIVLFCCMVIINVWPVLAIFEHLHQYKIIMIIIYPGLLSLSSSCQAFYFHLWQALKKVLFYKKSLQNIDLTSFSYHSVIIVIIIIVVHCSCCHNHIAVQLQKCWCNLTPHDKSAGLITYYSKQKTVNVKLFFLPYCVLTFIHINFCNCFFQRNAQKCDHL